MTPLGIPLLPEVNMITIGSLGSTVAGHCGGDVARAVAGSQPGDRIRRPHAPEGRQRGEEGGPGPEVG